VGHHPGYPPRSGRRRSWPRYRIKEGKHAVKWTRLSCTTFRANAVRLQLHALAYNLANFLRSLALPGEIAQWSLTTLREKVVKIGAKVVAHGRYLVFQMAEVAVPQELFRRLLDRIAAPTRRGPMLTEKDSRLSSRRADVPGACPATAIRRQGHPWRAAPLACRPELGHHGPTSLARSARPGLHGCYELGFGPLMWLMSA
jgi:hypothetical protein